MNKNLIKIIQEYIKYDHIYQNELKENTEYLVSYIYFYNNYYVYKKLKFYMKYMIKHDKSKGWCYRY